MTLYDFLRSDHGRPYSSQSIMSLLRGVYGLAEALHHIHSFAFIENWKKLRLLGYYRDLKPRNILVQGERFMIADFGFANFKGSGIGVGEATYRPPESEVGRGDVGQAYDIWSFGCILTEVATFAVWGAEGVRDFAERRTTRVTPLRISDYFHDGAGVKPEVLQHLQDLKSLAIFGQLESQEVIIAITKLVEQMLDPVADQRPGLSEVLRGLWKILSPSLAPKLKSLSPLASRLIRLCAFLGDRDIPEELLYRGRAIEWLKEGRFHNMRKYCLDANIYL